MAEKDVTERSLTSYNDVFANIVNGCFAVLGDGRPFRRVEPGRTSGHGGADDVQSGRLLHEQERDMAKL